MLFDRKILTSKWVFGFKYDLIGEIHKYKTRWVVDKHKQKYVVDYNETWASIVKSASFQLLLLIRILRILHIKQIDVVIAFVYGLLDKIVYVEQPHEFV